eukprot:356480-Chlamydomonas_euryale.AAC.1
MRHGAAQWHRQSAPPTMPRPPQRSRLLAVKPVEDERLFDESTSGSSSAAADSAAAESSL